MNRIFQWPAGALAKLERNSSNTSMRFRTGSVCTAPSTIHPLDFEAQDQ